MKNGTVVFAPHPDDEVLACGGLIAKRLNEGYNVSVVFITDGRNALKEIGVDQPSPTEFRKIRRKEAICAAEILGLNSANLFFFDIEDGSLQDHEESVRRRIVNMLGKGVPREVYFPQGKEFHADHRATNRLVRVAVGTLHHRPIMCEYAIAWRYPLNLLAHLRPDKTSSLLLSMIIGRRIIRINIAEFLALKKRAVEQYESQFQVMFPNQKRPALERPFVQRFLRDEEVFFVER